MIETIDKCDKKFYLSRKWAKRAARLLTKRNWKTMKSYKCPICSCFHLTSKTKETDLHYWRIIYVKKELLNK